MWLSPTGDLQPWAEPKGELQVIEKCNPFEQKPYGTFSGQMDDNGKPVDDDLAKTPQLPEESEQDNIPSDATMAEEGEAPPPGPSEGEVEEAAR